MTPSQISKARIAANAIGYAISTCGNPLSQRPTVPIRFTANSQQTHPSSLPRSRIIFRVAGSVIDGVDIATHIAMLAVWYRSDKAPKAMDMAMQFELVVRTNTL